MAVSQPERVGEILPRVLAQIEAAALARWRATTWPAVVADANAAARIHPCGDRWTVCRTCRHGGMRPNCLLAIGPEGTGASGYERR